MNLTDADKEKLRNALSVRGSINGNVLNLIGLDEVRARFPDMWERNRDRIAVTSYLDGQIRRGQAVFEQVMWPLRYGPGPVGAVLALSVLFRKRSG